MVMSPYRYTSHFSLRHLSFNWNRVGAWANIVIAAEPVIQHAYTPNELLVLEIIEEVISSHQFHTVPNRIVGTIRSKTTTTRHRDANTPAAHVCRRARDHDSCSGSDGPTIGRDCERHHIELRNWSCEHENKVYSRSRLGLPNPYQNQPRADGRHNSKMVCFVSNT